jgi:FkbH-like protein
MFDTDQYDRSLHHDDSAVPAAPYQAAEGISEVSLLYWGENCIECAAPSCYETCDLYEARPDKRCRRFRFGMYRNPKFRSLRGYGVEVFFKKWGAMAAMGNTSMVPRGRMVWGERLLRLGLRAMNLLGPALRLVSHDDRWKYPTFGLSRKLCWLMHRSNKGRTQPDAFVLEVYNPGAEPVPMLLMMDFQPESKKELVQLAAQPRFRTTLTFPPGYSRHDFERRLFEGITGSGLQFTIAMSPQADTTAHLVFLLADFVKYSRAAQAKQGSVKCLVWDLDNTLWDGTLVEDDNVRLKPGVRELLEWLDSRGVLLSIASKNTHEAAWRRLEALGVSEYFLAPFINWTPKSENIKSIAKKLNIGIDSLAFLDDSPFERSEVAAAAPEVLCIDARDMGALRDDPRFQGSTTADARHRRKYYQDAMVREEKQAEFGEDYLRFLKYCNIRLELGVYREADFDRVAELVQRTNQLNFSGQKYRREELLATVRDEGLEKYVLSCSDRFGSYGLVGFAMARHSAGEILVQDLMLSCRVQGKMIETALFSHLLARHDPSGRARLRVNFQETKRNQPARQVLEAARFRHLESGRFELGAGEGAVLGSGIVNVVCGNCSGAELAPEHVPAAQARS